MVVEKQTISMDECAKLLGVSRGTTFSAVAMGQLPHLKAGVKRIVIPVAALQKIPENGGMTLSRALGRQLGILKRRGAQVTCCTTWPRRADHQIHDHMTRNLIEPGWSGPVITKRREELDQPVLGLNKTNLTYLYI